MKRPFMILLLIAALSGIYANHIGALIGSSLIKAKSTIDDARKTNSGQGHNKLKKNKATNVVQKAELGIIKQMPSMLKLRNTIIPLLMYSLGSLLIYKFYFNNPSNAKNAKWARLVFCAYIYLGHLLLKYLRSPKDDGKQMVSPSLLMNPHHGIFCRLGYM